jgi:tetratricopeptide (TPR) repeat protein
MQFPIRSCRWVGFGAVSGFVALLALSGGCTPDVKDMRAQGMAEYRSQQYIESMSTMRHVLELSPNDAQANYYMGLNYQTVAQRKFNEGDVIAARRELDTAIVYYTQAIKSWPNYMAAVSAKTESLEQRGKYDQAVATAEYVSNNNKGIAEHYVFLGNEYRDRGDYDNALRAYKLALSTDPNNAPAYDAMSKLYTRIGDTALAADAQRKAEQLGGGRNAPQKEGIASPSAPAPVRPQQSGR